MKKKEFWLFLLTVAAYSMCVIGTIVGVNICIDASSVITPQHEQMARLALEGNIVAQPENYNERVFQVCIVDNMEELPGTVVIGSSRGMYLGIEITGYQNLYNNCVSGACVEDYYALLGLYYNKFGRTPERVIIETSPWVFYRDNPEARWQEDDTYHDAACGFYKIVNGSELAPKSAKKENPYMSLSYFQYNLEQLKENGSNIFKEEARISVDVKEAADYPDGSIRYKYSSEEEGVERLTKVRAAKGAFTYQNSDQMTEIDTEKALQYENLIRYLQDNGTDVMIFLSPFSETQCIYSLDENLNPAYPLAEIYLKELCAKECLDIRGSFDARDWGLGDERFIDSMHLDKKGTNIVWNY